MTPTKHPLEFTTFVALFPHLVAGPIVRYVDIEQQLKRPTRFTSQAAATGIFFFSCGLVKKLVFADQLAPHVDRLFAQAGDLGFLSSWSAAFGYSLQLYFDFSGYSDMAVGPALLIGFRFPQNFNSPFKAENISDFWRRWHITLSSWIRDYLFIPLGGSRLGTKRTALNFSWSRRSSPASGNGAAWTFVVWGLVHGALLAGHALLRKAGLTPPSVLLNRTVTFLVVVAASSSSSARLTCTRRGRSCPRWPGSAGRAARRAARPPAAVVRRPAASTVRLRPRCAEHVGVSTGDHASRTAWSQERPRRSRSCRSRARTRSSTSSSE